MEIIILKVNYMCINLARFIHSYNIIFSQIGNKDPKHITYPILQTARLM